MKPIILKQQILYENGTKGKKPMKKALCILMILAMTVALCACGHTAITPDSFASTMREKGYNVDTFEDIPDGGEGYYAYNDDESFCVSYVRWPSAYYAVQEHQGDLSVFDAMKGSSTTVSAGSFGCATKNSDGTFYISSYVDNTYIFGRTGSDQADAMKDLFKALGYK